MDVFDILLGKQDFDLQFKNGDFRIGEVTDQNKVQILISVPGDFKESPTMGVGLEDYLNDERPGNMLDTIRRNLAADGMTVQQVAIDEAGLLDIDAIYE